MIVDNFVDDHRLCLDAGRYAKLRDLSLKELTDIQIVPVISVGLVAISVGLALGSSSGLGFRNFLVEVNSRRSTMECSCGSWITHIFRRLGHLLSGAGRAILNDDGYEEHKRLSKLVDMTKRAVF